jgi:hypothetical protein
MEQQHWWPRTHRQIHTWLPSSFPHENSTACLCLRVFGTASQIPPIKDEHFIMNISSAVIENVWRLTNRGSKVLAPCGKFIEEGLGICNLGDTRLLTCLSKGGVALTWAARSGRLLQQLKCPRWMRCKMCQDAKSRWMQGACYSWYVRTYDDALRGCDLLCAAKIALRMFCCFVIEMACSLVPFRWSALIAYDHCRLLSSSF